MSGEGLTAEELEALPRGAVVIDDDGDHWVKFRLGAKWRHGVVECEAHVLRAEHGPIHLATPEPTTTYGTEVALLKLRAAVSEVLPALYNPGDLARIVAMGAHETLRRALDEAERLAAGE